MVILSLFVFLEGVIDPGRSRTCLIPTPSACPWRRHSLSQNRLHRRRPGDSGMSGKCLECASFPQFLGSTLWTLSFSEKHALTAGALPAMHNSGAGWTVSFCVRYVLFTHQTENGDSLPNEVTMCMSCYIFKFGCRSFGVRGRPMVSIMPAWHPKMCRI